MPAIGRAQTFGTIGEELGDFSRLLFGIDAAQDAARLAKEERRREQAERRQDRVGTFQSEIAGLAREGFTPVSDPGTFERAIVPLTDPRTGQDVFYGAPEPEPEPVEEPSLTVTRTGEGGTQYRLTGPRSSVMGQVGTLPPAAGPEETLTPSERMRQTETARETLLDQAQGNAQIMAAGMLETVPDPTARKSVVSRMLQAQHQLPPGDANRIANAAVDEFESGRLLQQSREQLVAQRGQPDPEEAMMEQILAGLGGEQPEGGAAPALAQPAPTAPAPVAPTGAVSWQERATQLRDQGLDEDQIIARLRQEGLIR